MKHPIDNPRTSARGADARLRQFFADAIGVEVLSNLRVRLETLSDRNRQRHTAIGWTRRLAVSGHRAVVN
ncbi:MAG: hypothetical protein ACM3SX_08275 [Deltaproteobacteria bacterium]